MAHIALHTWVCRPPVPAQPRAQVLRCGPCVIHVAGRSLPIDPNLKNSFIDNEVIEGNHVRSPLATPRARTLHSFADHVPAPAVRR